jgi:hypothetical protein
MSMEIATTPAPIEVVTPIKPSEAIRLGCLTTAQGRETYIAKRQGQWQACAYGAMAVGYGFDPSGTDGRRIDDFILPGEVQIEGQISESSCPAPACATARYDLLIHLNDDHRWSRERIADWLESLGL